ncbi:MAG: NRDE family protein [Flavobacteriaceae bacterium]|nr:NRDE family protein [Flavobacteriaceae bacterium]
MCTVTYIPMQSGFVLTSNRDEVSHRPTAMPKIYRQNGIQLLFPKDERAGGTWFAFAPEKQRLACLLNGAFEKHQPSSNYQKSRGKVLLESFEYSDFESFCNSVNLAKVEPFTLLLLDFSEVLRFEEIRWDEVRNLHRKKLQLDQEQIWSSSTLYPKAIRKVRESYFKQWLAKHQEQEDKNIFNFHTQKHGLSSGDDIVMQRQGALQTLSVTQLKVHHEQAVFKYKDLIEEKNTEMKFHQKKYSFV